MHIFCQYLEDCEFREWSSDIYLIHKHTWCICSNILNPVKCSHKHSDCQSIFQRCTSLWCYIFEGLRWTRISLITVDYWLFWIEGEVAYGVKITCECWKLVVFSFNVGQEGCEPGAFILVLFSTTVKALGLQVRSMHGAVPQCAALEACERNTHKHTHTHKLIFEGVNHRTVCTV